MTHMMPSSILSGPKSRRSILLKPISIMINVTGLGSMWAYDMLSHAVRQHYKEGIGPHCYK